MGDRVRLAEVGGGNQYTYSDYNNALRKWANNFETINSKDRDILESFIKDRVADVGPVKYAYGLSRGISMSDAELNKLEVGGTFAEGKLTSWSGQIGQAQSFARNNASDSKPNKVIIRTKSPVDQGAKLAGMVTGNKFAEAETIVSSKSKFKIDSIKKAKQNWQYTEVWVTPVN